MFDAVKTHELSATGDVRGASASGALFHGRIPSEAPLNVV